MLLRGNIIYEKHITCLICKSSLICEVLYNIQGAKITYGLQMRTRSLGRTEMIPLHLLSACTDKEFPNQSQFVNA